LIYICDSGCREDYGWRTPPRLCEPHGRPFSYEKQLGRSKPQSTGRKPRKRTKQKRRDWSAAIAKRDAEGHCRVCGSSQNVEAAHLVGREHDLPTAPGSSLYYVDPNSVIPLCGPFPDGCHGDFDHKRLDVLQYLTTDEQVKAVAEAGSIVARFHRRCDRLGIPSDVRSRLLKIGAPIPDWYAGRTRGGGDG
jgi:hypothetical protein